MDSDYEFLTLLRKNTILDPISYLKVKRARRLAEESTFVINSKEHCCLGVDYTKANELETTLRYQKWLSYAIPVWYKYCRNEDPDECAIRLLLDAEDGIGKSKKRIFK